jgi:DNA alkylation damage repair protein AlkB
MAVDDSEAVLRENEKLLRRCGSVTAGKVAVADLVVDAASSADFLTPLGVCERGTIYKFTRLKHSVYFIPGFLREEECEELTREILNEMIDNPPHSNNFGEARQGGKMWKEYRDPNIGNPSLKKLRWSCVGYHYNWGDRTYSPSQQSAFPTSLREIYDSVLETVNKVREPAAKLNGKAESAIINFYHTHRVSDRLGGHRDDVEVTDRTPLVSVSLGVPGFFLIENEAIVLRSGDVLVMAEEARQSLHGIPSIVSADRHDSLDLQKDTEREVVSHFLRRTRISISIRQVY